MKHIIAFAALFMTSCAPIQAHNVAKAVPATHESRLVNVARWGSVQVSVGGVGQHFAIDDDIDTWWTAHDSAPQWIEIDLRDLMQVDKIELIVTQASPGPATHKIRLEREGHIVVWHRFDTDLAADGHVFALRIDPPQYIDKVRILSSVMHPETESKASHGLLHPVQLTHAGDGSGRLFIYRENRAHPHRQRRSACRNAVPRYFAAGFC